MTRMLRQPILVDPPDCACKGLAPQMREHTAQWCSVLTTAEVNALNAQLDAEAEPSTCTGNAPET